MRFITLDSNRKVINIRTGTTIVSGEIQRDIGELGQIMQDDGTFIDEAITPNDKNPTLEEMQTQTLLNTEYLVIISELTNM